MSVTTPKLIDALIQERARVLFLLVEGDYEHDALDNADIHVFHVEQARREIELLLNSWRIPHRK
jgi:hypothetical protein